MNLAVDIGNTAVKAGFFKGDQLVEKLHLASEEDLRQLINDKKPSNVIISSTGKDWFEADSFEAVNLLRMNYKLTFPFKINYTTPNTLGMDRLAAVAGGLKMFPNENILAIDLGTCITYDFLSAEKIYYGGGISPGLKMRFKAMHNFTARLPELDVPEVIPDLVGDSTRSSMESGVVNGIKFEIEGIIAAYKKKYSSIKPIMTGGNIHVFEKNFKGHIFAAPDLVLIGLNVILQNNVARS